MKPPTRLQPSDLASQPKAGEPNFSPSKLLPASWGGSPRGWRDDLPKEDRGLLITLYTLVVLKDLGLDPASKQARKMIDRVGQAARVSAA